MFWSLNKIRHCAICRNLNRLIYQRISKPDIYQIQNPSTSFHSSAHNYNLALLILHSCRKQSINPLVRSQEARVATICVPAKNCWALLYSHFPPNTTARSELFCSIYIYMPKSTRTVFICIWWHLEINTNAHKHQTHIRAKHEPNQLAPHP